MSSEDKHHEHGDDRGDHGHHHEHHDIFIHIDTKKYKAPKHEMTGDELRLLAEPHISQEYNLWLETPGPGDDKLIENAEIIRLHDGMCFYSSLKAINPGASRATA